MLSVILVGSGIADIMSTSRLSGKLDTFINMLAGLNSDAVWLDI